MNLDQLKSTIGGKSNGHEQSQQSITIDNEVRNEHNDKTTEKIRGLLRSMTISSSKNRTVPNPLNASYDLAEQHTASDAALDLLSSMNGRSQHASNDIHTSHPVNNGRRSPARQDYPVPGTVLPIGTERKLGLIQPNHKHQVLPSDPPNNKSQAQNYNSYEQTPALPTHVLSPYDMGVLTAGHWPISPAYQNQASHTDLSLDRQGSSNSIDSDNSSNVSGAYPADNVWDPSTSSYGYPVANRSTIDPALESRADYCKIFDPFEVDVSCRSRVGCNEATIASDAKSPQQLHPNKSQTASTPAAQYPVPASVKREPYSFSEHITTPGYGSYDALSRYHRRSSEEEPYPILTPVDRMCQDPRLALANSPRQASGVDTGNPGQRRLSDTADVRHKQDSSFFERYYRAQQRESGLAIEISGNYHSAKRDGGKHSRHTSMDSQSSSTHCPQNYTDHFGYETRSQIGQALIQQAPQWTSRRSWQAESHNTNNGLLPSVWPSLDQGPPAPVQFAVGDWFCPQNYCGYHNFQKNTVCRECGHPRPVGDGMTYASRSKNPPLGSEGDWKCVCGYINWRRRIRCYNCCHDHPSNQDRYSLGSSASSLPRNNRMRSAQRSSVTTLFNAANDYHPQYREDVGSVLQRYNPHSSQASQMIAYGGDTEMFFNPFRRSNN